SRQMTRLTRRSVRLRDTCTTIVPCRPRGAPRHGLPPAAARSAREDDPGGPGAQKEHQAHHEYPGRDAVLTAPVAGDLVGDLAASPVEPALAQRRAEHVERGRVLAPWVQGFFVLGLVRIGHHMLAISRSTRSS